jgi:hypothetical protein
LLKAFHVMNYVAGKTMTCLKSIQMSYEEWEREITSKALTLSQRLFLPQISVNMINIHKNSNKSDGTRRRLGEGGKN